MGSTFRDMLRSAKSVAIFSGAGVSTDSGIPDFQTVDNNWRFKKSREDMLSLDYFRENPAEFWEAYRYIFDRHLDATPNVFHSWVASLQNSHKVTVITQNVDGLDVKAGVEKVIEIHGNLREFVCLNKRCKRTYERSSISNFEPYPVCLNCSSVLKPNVVLFGEKLQHYDKAMRMASYADLMIVAGTSLNVSPANLIPFEAMRSMPAIWVNNHQPPKEYSFEAQHIGSLKDFVYNIK